VTLTIFDLETTGLSAYSDEILQIAAVRLRVGEWVALERFATFVRPSRRVPSHITALTGITQADVAGAPLATEALVRFSQFVGEGSTLIAHNGARFDVPFLRESCLRHALPVRETSFIDSCNLSRQLWGGRGGHGLDAVMDRLGLSAAGVRRHDARGDVDLLARAVQRMWERLKPAADCCPVALRSAVLPAISQ
jgi:DNA polymerase III subunit epsilon